MCVCVTDNEQGVYKCVYEKEREREREDCHSVVPPASVFSAVSTLKKKGPIQTSKRHLAGKTGKGRVAAADCTTRLWIHTWLKKMWNCSVIRHREDKLRHVDKKHKTRKKLRTSLNTLHTVHFVYYGCFLWSPAKDLEHSHIFFSSSFATLMKS